MDEEAWLTYTDPPSMLEFLRGKASDRKLRLYAVACCQRVGHAFCDERSRAAVEAVERYADGLATLADVEAAHLSAAEACRELWDRRRREYPERVARDVSADPHDAFGAAYAARMSAVQAAGELAWKGAAGQT